MKLTESDLDTLLALAMNAARKAAALIQTNAGNAGEIESKPGGDTLASQVVTKTDFASQDLILETLSESMEKYDLGLLTEESQDNSSRFQRDYFWCIDPLDGTLPFTENQSGYSVSIALVGKDGVSNLGVVADPRTGNLYHARMGGGTYRNGQQVRPTTSPSGKSLTWIMDRSFRKIPDFAFLQSAMETLSVQLGLDGLSIIDHGGAAMNALWVLENEPAVYFKFPKQQPGGGSLWDYAATACLFSEMGIAPTDIHGSPLDLNRRESTFMNRGGVVYATHEELSARVRQLYQSF